MVEKFKKHVLIILAGILLLVLLDGGQTVRVIYSAGKDFGYNVASAILSFF